MIHFEPVADIPANSAALAFLQQRGTLARADLGPAARIGAYVGRSHPEYVEVLLEAARDTTAVPVTAFGYVGLAHPNGVLSAFVRGNYGIELRLPAAQQQQTTGGPMILDNQDLGPGWVAVSPWYTEPHARADPAQFAEWVARAFKLAGVA
jgi:hypothetical protein